MAEVIRLQKYSFAYPGASRYVLRDIDLSIRAGECHCLGGSTGSGKTSLALALKGLLPDGETNGVISRFLPGGDGAGGLGIVLQNPETQILRRSVGAETAFGLENLCVLPAEMPGKVRSALDQAGLDKSFEGETGKLSMGEKYRLILAGQLVMGPALLIIDEPAAQLDPAGLENLLEIIRRLKVAGTALLLLENRPGPLQAAIDHYWHLNDTGQLLTGPLARPASNLEASPPRLPASTLPPEDNVIDVLGMTIGGAEGLAVWSDVSFAVPPGQRVVLTGSNGSGKTTMLRCLTGFLQPDNGTLKVFGAKPQARELRGRVGCLYQNPQKQLFETTVFDEVAFPLRRLRENRRELAARVTETLVLCGIENLAPMSPHTLSFGQKHLVALASVLVIAPQLLLLDDPFAGLDPKTAEKMLRLLTKINVQQDTTIVLATHEPKNLSCWADQTLTITGGNVVSH